MSPRRGRTRSCDQADARTRFSLAQKFIEVAGIVEGEADPDFWSVAASLAVLAGIAADDDDTAAAAAPVTHRLLGAIVASPPA